MGIAPLPTAAATIAAAGVGTAALTTLAPDERPGRKVAGIATAAAGTAVAAGSLLARNGAAFGPLLGIGVGMAGAGAVDLLRGAGGVAQGDLAKDVLTGAATGAIPPRLLLPDGVQAPPEQVYVRGDELRFNSVVGNRGSAPLQLALHRGPNDELSDTNQVMFYEDGTATEQPLQGELRLDARADHSHLHFDDFVFFQLYKAGAGDRPDIAAGEIDKGVKQSFYITDVQQYPDVPAENLAAASKLSARGRVDRDALPADVMQGISVGWADVYGSGLEGQSLNVKDAAPGRYVLRQTFDPNDQVKEADERNNTQDVVIDIGRDRSVHVVKSGPAPASEYVTRPDGRVVIPAVEQGMERGVDGHSDGGLGRGIAAFGSPLATNVLSSPTPR